MKEQHKRKQKETPADPLLVLSIPGYLKDGKPHLSTGQWSECHS